MQAKGDAVVQIDADLQDSPNVILDFLQGWEQGFKVVVGVRRNRQENWFKSKFRVYGYAFISRVARFRITQNAGDFRLIDREVIEVLRESQNPNPYLRGAIAGFGFPEKQVFYDRKKRENGESKFGLKAVLKLGFEGLINHSNFLLRVTQVVFTLSLVLSLVGVSTYIVTKVSNESNVLPPGFTSTIVLIFISITINALFFVVCIKYLDNIYRVVTKNEPIVVLDKI
jgi:dolichol-phosphate mannosyltransferase